MPATSTHPVKLPPAKPDHTSTRPPNSKIGVFFWRWRMWFESTFVLSMLEPWEKLVILSILGTLSILLSMAIYSYLPHHVAEMRQRTVYYLWGQDGDERLLRQWIAKRSGSSSQESTFAGLNKEL